jgi:glycosyltransferase involved in cell wall biosynthesis
VAPRAGTHLVEKIVRLSIIIPAYNEEDYLPACLNDVLAEVARSPDPDDIEVLVVDNASTDATADVAYGMPGVSVVHEPVKGLTRARQAGLEAASGDIIAFVDADTRMPAGWIARVLRTFERKPNVVCVSGPYIYYDAAAWQRAMVRLYWIFLASPAYWMTRYMVVGGNFAVRRSALEEIGGFDTSIAFYGEDTNIARRLKATGRVKFLLRLPMPTSSRRLAAEGMTSTAFKYAANFLGEAVLKRPLTEEYRDIRGPSTPAAAAAMRVRSKRRKGRPKP